MKHADNPSLVMADGTHTRAGREYLGRLADLSGVIHDRLVKGKWVQAEGAVYDGWDAAVHVIDRFAIPPHWRRYWAIDFGYTNPLAWQWWAEDGDGRLYLYREIYQPRREVRDLAEWAVQLSDGEPPPDAVVTDHDPEAMAQIERYTRMTCTPAEKVDRKGGIQEVALRLKTQADGRARLYMFRDALCHEPIQELRDSGRPTRTEAEFDGYVWSPNKARGEEPLKENDHGMDAIRYLCRHLAAAPIDRPWEAPPVGAAFANLPGDIWR